jgi:uncharacterized membrane protein
MPWEITALTGPTVINDPLLLLASLFAVVAFARYLESRFKFVERISSAVLCTLLGITLANIGVIPTTSASPTTASVFEFSIPYAIVLMIIGTNVREIVKAGRSLLIAYMVAVFGSFAGGLACGILMNAFVGPDTWRLSGAFSGAFAGGGMNFAAVGQSLEIPPSTFAAAAVADNLSTVPYLLAQVGLVGLFSAVFLRRARPGATAPFAPSGQVEGSANAEAANPWREWTVSEISITDVSILGGLP